MTKTEDTTLPTDLEALAQSVLDLPEPYKQRIAVKLHPVLQSCQQRRKILKLVQDALGQLRLDMKYLAFDLEATRRERDELRNKYGVE